MKLKKTLALGTAMIIGMQSLIGMPTKSYASEESNNTTEQNINKNEYEYTNIKEELLAKGFNVDDSKFNYDGLTYTKVTGDDTVGLIEEGQDHITTYLLVNNADGTYTLTAKDNNGNEAYKIVDEKGKAIHSDGTILGMNKVSRASACDWGVGLSGVAISSIYGGAIGLAFGGPAGLIASAATGAAWIPVSSACK